MEVKNVSDGGEKQTPIVGHVKVPQGVLIGS